MKIPIDFVAGTHGHFLEIVLNKFYDSSLVNFEPFNKLGASHRATETYLNSRKFVAQHWFENSVNTLTEFDHVVSIQFDQDDLLLVSSVSLLRAGDMGIDNQLLEVDTFQKLNNVYYQDMLAEILNAYPFIKATDKSIPRNVLREFFKFGFATPEINGYWRKQKQMQYKVPFFIFKFKAFYDYNLFVTTLKDLENFLGLEFKFNDELQSLHQQFLNLIPYVNDQAQCDDIISAVWSGEDKSIPDLTLLQESYINAQMENIYKKEMPYHALNYFTSTKDMLNYIETQAPSL